MWEATPICFENHQHFFSPTTSTFQAPYSFQVSFYTDIRAVSILSCCRILSPQVSTDHIPDLKFPDLAQFGDRLWWTLQALQGCKCSDALHISQRVFDTFSSGLGNSPVFTLLQLVTLPVALSPHSVKIPLLFYMCPSCTPSKWSKSELY